MMKKKAAATNAMRDISLALLVLVIRAKLGTLLTELAQLGHAKNVGSVDFYLCTSVNVI
jgi:hypothetical protein